MQDEKSLALFVLVRTVLCGRGSFPVIGIAHMINRIQKKRNSNKDPFERTALFEDTGLLYDWGCGPGGYEPLYIWSWHKTSLPRFGA